ncbi:Probable E3 ubiquitin-protein ligase DTX2 [Geodia barretti]|uniref:E3 ubiquitin-protein ligase n=1 Tax=Geodia barretti TaxID=519541 RepID=A0AA35XGU9_GEOBA|nr:Probable E3 ubiquitin-protein ligase DTX2 [Geodia barretti]CAI8056994.1 Probable E3 ubiquitin-protein ligase DTX2 [Geodia barretti]
MPDGTMAVRHTRGSLPGHEGCGTIEIVYNFSPGVHNGRHYRTNGFPRMCYLPDTEKGQKVGYVTTSYLLCFVSEPTLVI